MAEDPTNNTEWVILAICGALVVCTAAVLLCVFCCCGLCGRGGGGAGGMCGQMCMPGGGQQVIIQQVAPAPTDTGPPATNISNPVPDPTFVSDYPSGGTVKMNNRSGGRMQLVGGNGVNMIRMEKNNPMSTVKEVVKQYYGVPKATEEAAGPRPPAPAGTQTDPVTPTFVVEDSGYPRVRAEAPYTIIRNRDGNFDDTTWVPPWQR